jgi:predicted ATPase
MLIENEDGKIAREGRKKDPLTYYHLLDNQIAEGMEKPWASIADSNRAATRDVERKQRKLAAVRHGDWP